MSQAEFNYDGNITIIQCNKNEKMGEIFKRFVTKTQIDINTVFFLFEGNLINEELIFEKYISGEEKMKILVYRKGTDPDPIPTKKKSKNIICPKCQENTKIKIDDYKISFYKCKNDHQLKNILINEFEKTQFIDLLLKINFLSVIYANKIYVLYVNILIIKKKSII